MRGRLWQSVKRPAGIEVNMKKNTFIPVALCIGTFTLNSVSAKATAVIDFAAAGSSAQFATFTRAFLIQGYTSHYSLGSSASFQIAPVVPAIPAEAGVPNQNAQVAIYWYIMSSGVYHVAVFYQVDSTVGVRAFFNSDTLTASANPPAPINIGQPRSGDVVPPAEVLAAVNGTAVNVGATDITPEDARVATERTINLGYSVGNPLKSATNATSTAFPVRFDLSARPFSLIPFGATPIVVFVNNGPTFGSSALAGANLNIDSFQLAGFLSGQFNRTSDLIYAPSPAQNPIHTYIAEPLSGTYNVIEYTNVESLGKLAFTGGRPSGLTRVSGGQELNVASNPLNEPVGGSPNGNPNAGRIRVIGDIERINAVAGDKNDALGYAFWSVGNFQGQTSLRYLTVDGAEPLQDSYTGGSVSNPSITFRNIVNGGYPLWSILRVVTPPNPTPEVNRIVAGAANANLATNYVTFKALRVFRSRHATPYTVGVPSNGVKDANGGATINAGVGVGGEPGVGGDVGGAVFSLNNDLDYNTDFGAELINVRQ